MCLLNTSVLLTFLKYRTLRRGPNLFVANLAVADLLVGLSLIFWGVKSLVSELLNHRVVFVCVLYTALSLIAITASLLCLWAVSLERYIKVVYPLRHEDFLTPKVLMVIRISCWITAVIFGGTVLVKHYSENEPTCDSSIHLSVLCILFALALLVMTFFYYRIFRIAFKQKRRISTEMSNCARLQQQSSESNDGKLLKMMVLLVGFLYLFWLPFLVIRTLLTFGVHFQCSELLQGFVIFLRYLNGAVNPIVYYTCNEEFRTSFRDMLGSCRGRASKREARFGICSVTKASYSG